MYKKIKLNNGVRVVMEHIPYVRSVSLGIWVYAGSRNETPKNNGISHFIEHMLFKGTNKRTAKEIAEKIDFIGGQLNAFTAKEYTCFYTKTLDEHVDLAIDILSDMFFYSKIDKKDIEVERKVIEEEIHMYEDSPEELVHDILSETVWENDALGYPILGTEESINLINRRAILEYMQNYYAPANTVISIAGNFDYNSVIEQLRCKFGQWQIQNGKQNSYRDTGFKSKFIFRTKDIEQVHMCIGYEGIAQGEDSIFDLLVINNVLGGGASSRLFQKIREEKGLVYSIYSYPSSYKRAGLFTIYTGMNPLQTVEVTRLIGDEIKLLKHNKLNEDEVEKAKEQLKGSYILGLESTSSRMNSIGKSELLLGKIKTPDEIINDINTVTAESVAKVIDRVFDSEKISISVVGAMEKEIDLREYLQY